MTPDGIYIVERHPLHAQVVYACGFSGTGYKFSPVIGEILSDLVTGSATTFDTSMFASGRFADGAHTENPRQGDHVTGESVLS
jgi:glycine/D-amino acid oxidase-like deaminating enzyme